MATSRTTSRKCPTCGADNSDLSLFCAECGASLNANGAWNEGDRTEEFRPAPSFSSWSTPADPGQRTNSGTFTAASTPPPYATFGDIQVTNLQPVDRGARGFWLGVLAWILIAVVFGLYLWAAVLGEGLKDDIRDIVPGLAALTWPGR